MFLALLLTQVFPHFSWQKLLAVMAIVAVILLAGALALLPLKILTKLPAHFRITLFIVAPLVATLFMPAGGVAGIGMAVAMLLLVALAGAAIAVLRKDGFQPRTQKVTLSCLAISVLMVVTSVYVLFGPRENANPILNDFQLMDRTLNLPNPGLRGTFQVKTFTYDWRRSASAGICSTS